MTQRKHSDALLRRGVSRLSAIQAVYQVMLSSSTPDEVVQAFLEGEIGGKVIEEDLDLETEVEVSLVELDAGFFVTLVRGVHAMTERLDRVVRESLGGGWDADRLGILERAILYCGLYEIIEHTKFPARACLSEYVDIAHAFFEGSEPSMINAVLDRVARQVRPEEMASSRSQPSESHDDPV